MINALTNMTDLRLSIKLKSTFVFELLFALYLTFTVQSCTTSEPKQNTNETKRTDYPLSLFDSSLIPHDSFGDSVRYGRELLLNTAKYIGPEGSVAKHLGNKMNCTNCHLDGGSRPFGLNFFTTFKNYPQYRGRENAVLSLADRINNCIERPHNGTPMPINSKEIMSIVAYIKWIGTIVPKDTSLISGTSPELTLPLRAADPLKGSEIYDSKCKSCHGATGAGILNADSTTYIYPPLWGMQSYQLGSSMHRVLKAARFIKSNMPHNQATWNAPQLTDEEAIDIAAFINDDKIHPRPYKKATTAGDYPVSRVKPIDYDIPPFEDTFSSLQHKYGPFKPIIEYHMTNGIPIVY
jgi:thiosulfate dehydrogenase